MPLCPLFDDGMEDNHNVGVPDDDLCYDVKDPFLCTVINLEGLHPLMTLRALLGPEAMLQDVEYCLEHYDVYGKGIDKIVEYTDLCNCTTCLVSNPWLDDDKEEYFTNLPCY